MPGFMYLPKQLHHNNSLIGQVDTSDNWSVIWRQTEYCLNIFIVVFKRQHMLVNSSTVTHFGCVQQFCSYSFPDVIIIIICHIALILIWIVVTFKSYFTAVLSTYTPSSSVHGESWTPLIPVLWERRRKKKPSWEWLSPWILLLFYSFAWKICHSDWKTAGGWRCFLASLVVSWTPKGFIQGFTVKLVQHWMAKYTVLKDQLHLIVSLLVYWDALWSSTHFFSFFFLFWRKGCWILAKPMPWGWNPGYSCFGTCFFFLSLSLPSCCWLKFYFLDFH